MNIKKALTYFCTVHFMAALLALNAGAGMKLVPAAIRMSIKPGNKYTTFIKVQNISGKKEHRFDIYLERTDSRPAGVSRQSSIFSWIKVSPSSLLISPGGNGKITLDLQPPENVAGDFRLALIVDQAPDRETSTLPDENMNNERELQLGKHRRLGSGIPQKSGLTLVNNLGVGIPINIRVESSGLSEAAIPVSLGKLVAEPAKDGEGVLVAKLSVENTGDFDIQVQGACRIYDNTQKKLLKITGLSGQRVNIRAREKRVLSFVFTDSLSQGGYLTSARLKLKTTGLTTVTQKLVSAPLIIDDTLAATLKNLAGGGNKQENSPHVPLMVNPSHIDLSHRGGRIKPLTVTITNPTQKKTCGLFGIQTGFR